MMPEVYPMSSRSPLKTGKSKLQTRFRPRVNFLFSSFNFRNSAWKRVVELSAGLAMVLKPVLLHAQGCAMCYTSAAAAKTAAIEALRNGILVLLIPPVLMTTAIFALALCRQDRFNDQAAGGTVDPAQPGKLSDWLSTPATLPALLGTAPKIESPSTSSSVK